MTYTYISWHQRLQDEAAKGEQPATDLQSFLDHQIEQYHAFLEADQVNPFDDQGNEVKEAILMAWEILRDCANSASAALAAGDANQIAMAFWDLGQATERVQHPQKAQLIRAYDAALHGYWLKSKEHKRTAGLRNNTERRRTLKGMAQAIATSEWTKDKAQAVRVGDMSEIVYKALIDPAHEQGLLDVLPGDSSGIKSWLSEVAPAHARRSGRGKKK